MGHLKLLACNFYKSRAISIFLQRDENENFPSLEAFKKVD